MEIINTGRSKIRNRKLTSHESAPDRSYDRTGAIGGSISNDKQTLMIFEPTQLVDQCVRGYAYAFGEDAIDGFYNLKGASLKTTPDCVLQSIVPAQHGHALDMTNARDQFTFILVVDAAINGRGMLTGKGPTNRSIITGNFITEPYSLGISVGATPSMDMEAIMSITHVDACSASNSMSSMGMNRKIEMNAAEDVLHAHDGAKFDVAMARCDFRRVVATMTRDLYSAESVRNGEPLYIGEYTNGITIDEGARSASNQIRTIAKGIRTTAGEAANTEIRSMLSMETGGGDSSLTAPNILAGNIGELGPSGYAENVIAPTELITLGDFLERYPNTKIAASRTPLTPQIDVADPFAIDVTNIMAGMAANHVLHSARVAVLSSIAFKYDSFAPVGSDASDSWYIFEKATKMFIAIDNSDQTAILQSVRNFKFLLEEELFPILKSHSGDFSITVNCDCTGDTSVDLVYHDLPEYAGEYIVIHNNLGGLISPTLGSTALLETNSRAIRNVFDSISKPGYTPTRDRRIAAPEEEAYYDEQNYEDEPYDNSLEGELQ